MTILPERFKNYYSLKFLLKEEMVNKNKLHEESPFIAIPASLAGIFLVIVIMFLIFAKDQLNSLNSIVWAFVVIGVVAIIFAYKSKQKKKK